MSHSEKIIMSLTCLCNRKITHCHLNFLQLCCIYWKNPCLTCLMADMLVSSVSLTYFLLQLSLPVRMQLFVPDVSIAFTPPQVMKQLHPNFCNHQGATIATTTNKHVFTTFMHRLLFTVQRGQALETKLHQYLCFSFSSTRFYFASTLLLCAKKKTTKKPKHAPWNF